jgi:hypothetical protein
MAKGVVQLLIGAGKQGGAAALVALVKAPPDWLRQRAAGLLAAAAAQVRLAGMTITPGGSATEAPICPYAQQRARTFALAAPQHRRGPGF